MIMRGPLGMVAAEALASELGFVRSEERTLDTEAGWRVERDWVMDSGLKLVMVDDGVAGVQFVQVFGGESSDVTEIGLALEDYLNPYSYEDLLAACHDMADPKAKPQAVVRLGLGAPPAPDPDFSGCIAEALDSEDRKLREAGLWAASYYALRDFFPRIEKIAGDDPEQEVMDMAEDLAGVYRQGGLG